MIANPARIVCQSPDDTDRIAKRLGQIVSIGDCILLQGAIGAGKTHFARSFLHAVMDVPEDVPSPTFTIVQTYETRIGQVWHADLYRLGSPDELVEIGLADAFETAVCLIEWPDRLGDLCPSNALTMVFNDVADDPEARVLNLSWTDHDWDERLKKVLDA